MILNVPSFTCVKRLSDLSPCSVLVDVDANVVVSFGGGVWVLAPGSVGAGRGGNFGRGVVVADLECLALVALCLRFASPGSLAFFDCHRHRHPSGLARCTGV